MGEIIRGFPYNSTLREVCRKCEVQKLGISRPRLDMAQPCKHITKSYIPSIAHGLQTVLILMVRCRNTANNFVSPNTVGLKAQTSHTVGFEITSTPQCGILFTGIPHKKLSNTATPHTPMSPCYLKCLIHILKYIYFHLKFPT